MRVSTAQIFHTGTLGIQNNQNSLYRIQNQLSTGRRILSPEDDPIGASQALVVTQSKEINSRFLENQAIAQNQLSLLDNKLGSLNDELQRINELAIQGANGTLSGDQRGMIAQEINQRLENIIGLANSQDGTGLYIFSGFKSTTQPFQVTGSGGNYQTAAPANMYITYSGDSGKQEVPISPTQTMPVTESGAEVFIQVRDAQGNMTGRSIFDSVKNLSDLLTPGSGVPFDQTQYQQALADVGAIIDHVGSRRSSLGARMQALDSLTSLGDDTDLQYQSRLSQLQDVDYAAAISDLSHKQMQLEAAQESFKRTSQLSLFNIL